MGYKSLRERCRSLLEKAECSNERGELRIAGEDWVLMSAVTFRDFAKGMEKFLGSGAMVILFEVGRHAGKEFSRALLREGIKPEEVPELLEVFFTQGGWGRLQAKVNFTKKEAVVRIENCATARQTKAKETVCHFIRGYIAGVCNVMFDANIECEEIKCMAKEDAFCEFIVKRKLIS